jgi:predicted lipoprotein
MHLCKAKSKCSTAMIAQENKTMSATKYDVNHLQMVGEIQGPCHEKNRSRNVSFRKMKGPLTIF